MNKQPQYRYEVHTYALCGGWSNCWTTCDENHNEIPDSFPTIEAAQAEIEDLFSDIQFEIDAGERPEEEGYDYEDYRIYDKIKGEYVG